MNILCNRDVLQYLSDMKSSSSKVKSSGLVKPVEPVTPTVSEPYVSFTDIPLTNMRKTIAKRLALSKVSKLHKDSKVCWLLNTVSYYYL